MSFDEQPDGDPHGECAAEIARLAAELAQQKGWHANWLKVEPQYLARIDALEAALRESGEQLHMGAYHVGELGMAWTATIVTPECQKIQRTLKAAYQASLTALKTASIKTGE